MYGQKMKCPVEPFELSEGKKQQTLSLCMKTIFPCVPNDLLRSEVTDSEGGVTQIWVNFGL